MGLHLVLLGHRAADRRGDPVQLLPPGARPALHLLHQHQPLFASRRAGGAIDLDLGLDRERRAAARPQVRVAALGGELQVLRIVVAAAQDDEVLLPPGDEELAALDEAEVAGPQVRPTASGGGGRRGLGEHGAKILRCRLRLPPVATGDALAGDPDLPHPPVRQLRRARGVDDRDPLPQRRMPAADEPADRRARSVGRRRHGLATRQGRGVHRLDPRRAAAVGAGGEERRLGEAVAGIERRAAEAVRTEGVGEALESRGAHRLGTVEGHPPAREVEPLALPPGHLLDAELVGEVGAAGDRPAIAVDRLQPAPRPLQERDRRHQHGERAGVERLQHVPDQPHVMVERQPPHDHRLRVDPKGGADHPLVVHEVGVGDHHPLGRRRRSRGVLEEGDGAGIGLGEVGEAGLGALPRQGVGRQEACRRRARGRARRGRRRGRQGRPWSARRAAGRRGRSPAAATASGRWRAAGRPAPRPPRRRGSRRRRR